MSDKFISDDLGDFKVLDKAGNPISHEDFLGRQTPPEPTERDYSQIAPTGSEWFKAQFLTGPLTSLNRASARGQFTDADLLDQFLSPIGGMRESEMMSPADANEAWAPKGETWFDKPISSGLAQTVAEQKREDLERDSNLARYANEHSWMWNFGTNVAGMMLDPINAGVAFIPGIGEEAVAARLGGGVVARTAGRMVSGATAGAAASVPAIGAHLVLDHDLSLRDAFYDLAMGAAGGAVLQGLGEGGLRETGVLRPDRLMRDAAAAGQTASQTHAAITTAVGQLIQEKPIDVVPIVHPPATDLQVKNVRLYLLSNGLRDVPEEIIQKAAAIARTGQDIDVALAEARKISIPQTFASLAARQKELDEIGAVPGMSRANLLNAKGEIDAAATAKPEPEGLQPAATSEAGAPASAPVTKPGELPLRPTVSPESARLAPEEVQRILTLPEVQDSIRNPREINRTHDVPYLAGSNNEGGITFIDRRVPKEIGVEGLHEESVVIDPAIPLNVHEQVEHALMVKGGMPYESAHRIALVEERKAVESLGANWNSYQSVMEGLVHTTEHEDTKIPPGDLYTKPYPHQEAEFLKREAEAGPALPEATPEHLLDPEVTAAQIELATAQLKVEAFKQAAQCLVGAGI